jgi:two-component system autoinducer 2 sensor kinase/phosphatase LuxQ
MPTFLKPQCLAVDDDPLCLKLAEAACKKIEVELHKVSDVHQMIDMLKVRRFDLILLDNDIAGVRGHDVLDYTDAQIPPSTQIIVYSSSVNAQDREKYARFNVREYLVKPLSVDVISFAMRKALKL